MLSARFYATLYNHRSRPADPIDNAGRAVPLTTEEAQKARKRIASQRHCYKSVAQSIHNLSVSLHSASVSSVKRDGLQFLLLYN